LAGIFTAVSFLFDIRALALKTATGAVALGLDPTSILTGGGPGGTIPQRILTFVEKKMSEKPRGWTLSENNNT
jgi:hypothetical protein